MHEKRNGSIGAFVATAASPNRHCKVLWVLLAVLNGTLRYSWGTNGSLTLTRVCAHASLPMLPMIAPSLIRCREVQRLSTEVERLSIKHPYHNAVPCGTVQAPRPKAPGPSVSAENERLREEVAKLKDELNRLKLRAVPKPLVVVPPPPLPARKKEKEKEKERDAEKDRSKEKDKLEESVESSTASAPRHRRSASADDSMLGNDLADEVRAQLEEARHALAVADVKQAHLLAQVEQLRREAAEARLRQRRHAESAQPDPAVNIGQPLVQPQPLASVTSLAAVTERVALNLKVEDLEERLAVLTDAHRSLHGKHQDAQRELQRQRALVQDGAVQQATTAETIQQLKESKRALLQRIQELQQSLAESSAIAGTGERAASVAAALQQQIKRHEDTIRSHETTIEQLEESLAALRSDALQKAAHVDRLSSEASEVEFRHSEEQAELRAEVHRPVHYLGYPYRSSDYVLLLGLTVPLFGLSALFFSD